MMQTRLRWQLDQVAARYRRLRTWQVLALVWLAAAALAAVVLAARVVASLPVSAAVPIVCLAPCLLAAVGLWWAAKRSRDDMWLARQIESRYPDLGKCLMAAIELRPDLPDGRYGYLQASVIQQALDHSRRHAWQEIVSRRQILFAALANIAAFLLFVVAVVGVAKIVPPPGAAALLIPAPLQALLPGDGFSMTVEPGDTDVEKGTSLLVLARIQGTMPPTATLHFQPDGGDAGTLPMAASLDDPVFGGRIPLVEQDLSYHVEIEGQVSPSYRARVFEYPRLERSDAKLVYPKYTGLDERLVQDVRTISVVEGTELTLRCILNKSVASATLVDSAKNAAEQPLVLTPSTEEPLRYEATMTCLVSRKLKLELVDDAGRKNQKVTQFTINVNPNRPPTLKPVFPGKDLEVSALEEMDVRATAWDDFGVPRVGLTYSLAGQEPVDVLVMENGAAKKKHEIASQVKLEELRAEPDQLLSYFWWAEDTGPDGQVRRTMSDMYFAEVRPFDEIFRQGQQPPGGAQQQQQQQGQGQNAQQAEELAKLQKDIINATWKVLRREIGPAVTPPFAEDVEQIHLSQETAIEQAKALAERLQDEKSKELIADVLKHMSQASSQLAESHELRSVEKLRPVLPAAQSAYQALLKLRAREHTVIRQQQQQQQQQGQQSQQSQQRQQQLSQLDLKEEENRYETERTAQEQQQETAAERENRQVLNRLRELARRQDDLNERVKELQASLEAAESEQEKEELRRQLKRLQEEQRQILQDTDELRSRMDQPENAERLSDEREQLDETREQVRRASEALEMEKVTQAAASGTRAEQQFDELREEFRRKASEGFNDEMKEMRNAARELDEKEKELGQRLTDESKPKPEDRSLREPKAEDREKLATDLAEQRKRLETLQERMRETIDRAAETEPLLSERLYETARNLRDKEIDRALQVTERAVRQGLTDEARQIETLAGDGIRQMREGIEKAADGVLGDETEALRRAREELKTLSRDLNQEMVRNGAEPPQSSQPRQGTGQQSRQPGENPMGENEAGERQPQGEVNEPGERPEGDASPQPGQRPQRGGGQQPSQRQTGRPGAPMPGEGQQPGEGEGEPMPMEGAPGERPGNEPGESQQPGNRPGQQPGAGRRPGQRPAGTPGQQGEGNQPSEQSGQEGEPSEQPGETPEGTQPGQGQRPGQQPEQGRPGQGPGQRGNGTPMEGGEPMSPMPGGEQPGQGSGEPGEGEPMEGEAGQGQPGQSRQGQGQRGGQRPQPGGRQRGQLRDSPQVRAGDRVGGGSGPFEDYDPSSVAPLTGDDFREWSDRLRDVEEMVDDPDLRAQAARIREQARMIRAELKRHSAPPNWDIVRKNVAEPLIELEQRLSNELLRRAGQQALVPLDRDPVPPQYSEKTRKYYERLGSGLTDGSTGTEASGESGR